jgi:hypothetical protein
MTARQNPGILVAPIIGHAVEGIHAAWMVAPGDATSGQRLDRDSCDLGHDPQNHQQTDHRPTNFDHPADIAGNVRVLAGGGRCQGRVRPDGGLGRTPLGPTLPSFLGLAFLGHDSGFELRCSRLFLGCERGWVRRRGSGRGPGGSRESWAGGRARCRAALAGSGHRAPGAFGHEWSRASIVERVSPRDSRMSHSVCRGQRIAPAGSRVGEPRDKATRMGA